MKPQFILLPAKSLDQSRLLRIPEDYSQRDALRAATSLIADVQENNPKCNWEDLAASLEDHGFEVVEFALGPTLDCSK